jgi:phosphocarrier protein FPr
MVGIVVVSHSARLALGVLELAEQMVKGQVPLAAAGGIDDPDNPIGTDPMKVLGAIESVYSDDGVVVLMDLGSALMSAEVALELLAPEQRANVHMIAAPLVEGAMAAAVQASVGGTVEQVIQEAQNALMPKIDHLPPAGAVAAMPPTPQPAPAVPAAARTIRLAILNRLGLHARPAALLVSTANRFQAAITLAKAGKTANAKSINQVATLGANQGDEIDVSAAGPDVDAALEAIQALADDYFGEREEPVLAAPDLRATRPAPAGKVGLAGIGASAGVAVGPARWYRPQVPEIEVLTVSDTDGELARLQTASDRARMEIETLRRETALQAGASEAAIFDAHRLILQDPALHDTVRHILNEQLINVEAAWQQAIQQTADAYRAMESAYMQARAADILDVGQRVLKHLVGVEPPSLVFDEPTILVAVDLAPSDTARLNPDHIMAVCTELGGYTSHSAILARSRGIPAVVGLGPGIATIADGQIVGLDGATGQVWLSPGKGQTTRLRRQREAWLSEWQRSISTARQPAITRDGHRIEVAANIGSPQDAEMALQFGAEGVGLFRTEFLFLDRQTAPTEEEQLEAYRQAAATMGERPVIIRTLDIGGDKPLPYLNLGREDNPFLGWRGLRFCLDTPEIFTPQLRAILRASAEHPLKLMFPMVGALHEVRAARAALAQAQAGLEAEGLAFNPRMEVGIMIEVPSAAAIADHLAREVDFFSIGTNDLTQYVMAADRGNARVATLADALHPAVLRMIRQTVEGAHGAGIWVGMCGELAGDALAAPLLVGLGLDELSMNAPAIPAAKEAVRSLTMDEARRLAAQALQLESADAVRQALRGTG